MKRQKSLRGRFFYVILAILMVVNVASLYMLKYLFPQFQQNWKNRNIEKEVNEIVDKVENGSFSYFDFKDYKYRFFNKYDADLRIEYIGKSGLEEELWYSQEWKRINVKMDNGSLIKLIKNESDEWPDKSLLKKGNRIFIIGRLEDGLYVENAQYYDADEKVDVKYVDKKFILGKGTVENMFPLNGEEMERFVVNEEYWQRLNYGYNNRNDIYVSLKKEVSNSKGEKILVSVRVPSDRIDVFVSGLSEFYRFFFLLNAVVAVILAFICSKMLVKPILKISNAAERMKNLNFEEEYEKSDTREFQLIEESLSSLSHNLKDALDELTKELDEKTKQEEIRKEFVANVSHELKTPLSVIRCYTDMIHDGIEEDRAEEFYGIIIGEIKKMNKLVMQMLELSRVESGKIKLDIRPFKVEGVIEDVITMMEIPAQNRNLEIELSGEFSQVEGDEHKIEQVLTNLISNAVKYSEKNSIIEIKGFFTRDANRIEISNRCKNLEKDEIEKLWRRFYQRDKSRKNEGTGLGLAIVAAILELHKIEYGVEGIEGGVKFYFNLPMKREN